ncbi:synapse differentiation-inducing gene protein 1-like isoform X2 [Corticium candelabrum]|uniref:synapse differentiation-inducing gene protein 1-like isoform X2 n=1 Tax=Corticium candelabrum TaxID=121492 RepID=UPI002E260768|nr:synapse differentiation-inducing gene protein 1-like isoform X2 [Corticium candelabrum]
MEVPPYDQSVQMVSPVAVEKYPPQYSPQDPSAYPQQVHVETLSQINDYMGLSIFTLLCCCLPIGIFAVLNSMKVRDAVLARDEFTASEASATARKLNIIGIVLGCFILPAIIIVNVVRLSS